IENSAKANYPIIYLLDTDPQINATSKSINYRDVRVTFVNRTAVPYQLMGYNTNETMDAVLWLSSTPALGSTAYYIYYNNSAATDGNTTIFSKYEYFENQSFLIRGTYGIFDQNLGVTQNSTITKNPTNITSNSSIWNTGAQTLRKNSLAVSNLVQPFVISAWVNPTVLNSTSAASSGIFASSGGNDWGIRFNGTGEVQITSNSFNWVNTNFKLDSATKWYQFITQVNQTTGENYWIRNDTGLYFLGNESAASANFTALTIGLAAGASTQMLTDNILLRQSQSVDFNEYVVPNNISIAAEEAVSACQTLSTAGSSYLQMNNITNSASTQCVIIANQNITYDCGGFLIDGTDAGTSIGINVTASASNTTVKNCI
ncbi:MAG: DUF2341 domain-containing protein, partial [Nanoarchaeota archaeon]